MWSELVKELSTIVVIYLLNIYKISYSGISSQTCFARKTYLDCVSNYIYNSDTNLSVLWITLKLV